MEDWPWQFVFGTIFGAIWGAVISFFVPRVVTARQRAKRAARHITWAWNDFDVFGERLLRQLDGELEAAKEDLAGRNVLVSAEALNTREAIFQSYVDELWDEWILTSRRIRDIESELGITATRCLDADGRALFAVDHDRLYHEAQEKLSERFQRGWPRAISE